MCGDVKRVKTFPLHPVLGPFDTFQVCVPCSDILNKIVLEVDISDQSDTQVHMTYLRAMELIIESGCYTRTNVNEL